MLNRGVLFLFVLILLPESQNLEQKRKVKQRFEGTSKTSSDSTMMVSATKSLSEACWGRLGGIGSYQVQTQKKYELYHSSAVIQLRGSFKKPAFIGCICMVILNNVQLNRHQYVVYFFCLAGVEANEFLLFLMKRRLFTQYLGNVKRETECQHLRLFTDNKQFKNGIFETLRQHLICSPAFVYTAWFSRNENRYRLLLMRFCHHCI